MQTERKLGFKMSLSVYLVFYAFFLRLSTIFLLYGYVHKTAKSKYSNKENLFWVYERQMLNVKQTYVIKYTISIKSYNTRAIC